MTRLTEEHVSKLGSRWLSYEQNLKRIAGTSLLELAATAAGVSADDVRQKAGGMRVAAIPISSGEGLIGGFAEALASIAEYLGFMASVLPPDEEGFREAREQGFDLCIWADDDTYLAESFISGVKAENGAATGIGFAEALLHMAQTERMAGKDSRVLVLGAGPVGRAGAVRLAGAGWQVFLCDTDRRRAEDACRNFPELKDAVPCSPDELAGLGVAFPYLLDAAPTDDCHPEGALEKGAAVSAPCVPCTWQDGEELSLWHDPLQLGTAVMLLGAAFRSSDI